MKPYTILSSLFAGLFLLAASPAPASALDFGWGQPVEIKPRSQNRYLVWPIQISNPGPTKLTPTLEIVVVTDTGKQYYPQESTTVSAPSGSGELVSMASLQSHIFPSVTRRAAAVFEQVDPKAKVLRFYIGGLTAPPPNRHTSPYLQVTYTRTATGWTWTGTSVME